MRVLVVTNIARPYRHALFNEGARLLHDGGELHVAYTSRASAHRRRSSVDMRLGATSYVTWSLPGLSLRSGTESVVSVIGGLTRVLRSVQPHVAIVGGFGPDAAQCHLACHRHNVPIVLWSGAWPGGEGRVPLARKALRRWMARTAHGAVCYGTLARDYAVELGVNRQAALVSTNTVDIERFANLAATARRERGPLAQRFGMADRNLVCVSQLVPRKGVDHLLRAAAAMSVAAADWRIHIVGAGPMDRQLRELALGLGLGDHARFHGFLQEDDVARLLALSDGMVFPTLREIWGLVVNEALACGVPVVSSVRAGATHDIVHDGVNGFLVDPASTRDLAACMATLVRNGEACGALGEAAGRLVRVEAGLDRSAKAFLDAARMAAGIDASGPLR